MLGEGDRYAQYCLYCEVVKWAGGGQMGSASTLHLCLADHVRYFDAAQQDPGAAECLESQHGSRASPDRPTVLFDEVVEVFGLADLDGRFIRTGLVDGAVQIFPLALDLDVGFIETSALADGTLRWRNDFSTAPATVLSPSGARCE
ncbi:hypothetical protein OKW28_003570 [Paraburkholderia sp. 40]